MYKREAFLWGALGGLLPVLLTAVTIDLAPLIDHPDKLSLGEYIGYGIRVGSFVMLGGVIALLNAEIRKPLALVQLGIAAPALIATYVAGKVPDASEPTHDKTTAISIITPAMADEIGSHTPVRLAGFLNDVTRGITTPLGSIARENAARQYPSTFSPNRVGSFCATSAGRFGPGPTRPLGAHCSVNLPSGSVSGRVTE